METYIVLADWIDEQTTEEVTGFQKAKEVAETLQLLGGAVYTAIIDKDGKRVWESS